MRTRNVLFSAVLLAVLLLGVGNAFAQQPATTSGCVSVIVGDTIWGFDPNYNLKHLADINPDIHPRLDDISRLSDWHGIHNGRVDVAIGTCIFGVTRKGSQLIPTPAPKAAAPTAVPAPPKDSPPAPVQSASKTAQVVVGGSLLLILLIAAALALTVWFLRRRDPAGAPERRFAREGVQPEQARAHANTVAPQVHPGRPFIVLSQTRQRARGAVISEYLNPARQETVVLDGGPNSYVYRTQLRFTDTNEEVEMPFLAACGNPIRYGTIARYIYGLNFEYLGEPEVVPEPVAAPAAPEPVPVPAAVAPPAPVVAIGTALALREGDEAFGMRRFGESVVIELVAGDSQIMVTVLASTVRYQDGQFTFDAAGLPAGISVPVPADIIARAVIGQLTAPSESEEEAMFKQLLVAQTKPTA